MTYGSQTWTMTIKEMNTLRIFERKIVRKIHEPVKEGEPWRIRTNKEMKDTLQGQGIVKFIKSLHLRWYSQLKNAKARHATTNCSRYNGRHKIKWNFMFGFPCIIR